MGCWVAVLSLRMGDFPQPRLRANLGHYNNQMPDIFKTPQVVELRRLQEWLAVDCGRTGLIRQGFGVFMAIPPNCLLGSNSG